MAQSNFFPIRPALTPQIYAYSDPRYEGLLKVGYTTRDVQKRIADQYPVKLPDGKLPTRSSIRTAVCVPTAQRLPTSWYTVGS